MVRQKKKKAEINQKRLFSFFSFKVSRKISYSVYKITHFIKGIKKQNAYHMTWTEDCYSHNPDFDPQYHKMQESKTKNIVEIFERMKE